MKNRKKTLLLLITLGLALMMMIGGIVAGERFETHSVYNSTPSNELTFTAGQSQESWSWSVYFYILPETVWFVVRENGPSGPIILNKAVHQNSTGSINIQPGHTYYMWTPGGGMSVPGVATCSVYTGSGGGDKPSGP